MSYRGRSRNNYANQIRHSNSLGYQGNRNYNRLDNHASLSNNNVDSDTLDYQFVTQEAYPVLLKAKLSMTRNPWSMKLNSDRLKPEQLIALCSKQPIEIILCDRQTKEPLRTFKVQKIADMKQENSDLEAYQKLSDQPIAMPNQLSSLKSAIQPYGYSLVEVLKK